MRKIEQQMIAAIRSGKSWQAGNTAVSVEPAVTRIFLHGNHIATMRNGLSSLDFTLAGWPTRTTKSRLNALVTEFIHANAGVYTERHKDYYRGPDNWEGYMIGPSDWVQA